MAFSTPSAHPVLIANARMYSVAPGAIAAWKRLFAHVIETSGVALTVIDHAFPAALNDLWRRDDLALTFMCGWPWARLGLGHQIVAAPVPAADYAGGQPVYRTEFVVHRDSAFQRLEDTFGHRFAFTIDDSHSGYNAPRRHLLQYRTGDEPLYGEIIGPLTTPRRMLEAIAEGRTDVGPLDSFAYALLQRHEPELAAMTRMIAATDLVPIPALMASKVMEPAIVERLRATLLEVHETAVGREILADLTIARFASLDPAGYAIGDIWAADAERAGYPRIR
jgi:ABC-type phosphate/phosphonate transport system substrate-binding protein